MKPDEMKDRKRKRRFNEGIVNMLYPSPPQPQPRHEPELEPAEEPSIHEFGSDVISGTSLDASTTEKLTRAQRKKIRKKKLTEEAIHRGKLIGPLLPLTPIHVPAVRSNAPEEEGDERACAKSVKVKHRRMAKRFAKQNLNASSSEITSPKSDESRL